MSAILEADRQARWRERAEQGDAKRQAKRVWVVDWLKADITEPEWFAATRAVEECGTLFEGREIGAGFQIYRDPRTGLLTSGTEQSILRASEAMQRLYGLRQAVSRRCDAHQAANGAEWIVQRLTAWEIAVELGHWRRMGTKRDPIPDTRTVKPFMRLVLLAMAGYYADCDLSLEAAA